MTNEEKAKEIASQLWSGNEMNGDVLRGIATMAAVKMADWKDEQFWSYQNIEKIIKTYKSFPDRSCPGELVNKTIEKLKPENTK